jgi:hypothetical protein
MALDEINQRLWFVTTDGTNGGIYYWYYRTAESIHEVASTGTPGSPGEVSPAINLGSGSVPMSLDMGSDRTVYVAIHHTSAGFGGLITINPDTFATQQWTTSNGFPDSQCEAAVVDKSRARTNGGSTAFVNAGTDVIDCASGNFSSLDIGRVIKITGTGMDNGSYLVATVNSATQITVTTLAGGAVSFIGGGGNFQIGDRIYLFFSDNTTNAGKMRYMDSLEPGTFRERAVTMTNGAQIRGKSRHGEFRKAYVDQRNGNVYWLSVDTQHQINKYDFSANTHSFRTIANVQTPSGGTGTLANITDFVNLLLNEAFDELWIGTDQGFVKIDITDFTGSGAYKRYHGSINTTNYENPAGFLRSGGYHSSFGPVVRSVSVGVDGQVYAVISGAANAANHRHAKYSRECDNWFETGAETPTASYSSQFFCDPYGHAVLITPGASASVGEMVVCPMSVHYQWDSANSKWIPKEFARGALPNHDTSDTIGPSAKTRPLHSTTENLIHGLKIRFQDVGGATPPNNEFLGRAGIVKPTGANAVRTDGSTSTGAPTEFNGSAFQASDAGKYLRIHGGADAGVYIINTFVSATKVTLKLVNGTNFATASNTSGVTYSVWDIGTAGVNAGPENLTCMVADGFGKDTSQDLTGIEYEFFLFKTVLSKDVESTKFCIPPTPPPGSTAMGAAIEIYNKITTGVGQMDVGLAGHKALPVLGYDQLSLAPLDFGIDKQLHQLAGKGKPNYRAAGSTLADWFGNTATTVHGSHVSIDFGKSVEVGSILIRCRGYGTHGSGASQVWTTAFCGIRCELYNAPDSGAPGNSATVRFNGAGLACTSGSTTVSVASGDFLGPASVSGNTTGAITAGQSVFRANTGVITQSHVGMILKITAGAGSDIGSYRILSVTDDAVNSFATIRNLDMTDKTWLTSASSITFDVRDGVQEGDAISIASGPRKFLVERLLTTTTLEVRIPPNATLSSQAYDVIKPTWTSVKKLSTNFEATLPEVKNNKTWICSDGKEAADNQDFKMFFDLTDLSVGKRSGRYWRVSAMPRANTSGSSSSDFSYDSIEFYDPSGNRIPWSAYNGLDTVTSEPNFMACGVNRVDFIQASNSAMGAGFNGNVSLGGADGDTITLVNGSNKFLGFQVRPKRTNGGAPGANNTFTGSGFVSSDVGRFLRVLTGSNAGYYRIASVVSATSIAVTSPAGNPVTLNADGGTSEYTLHEGINGGSTTPDYIRLQNGDEVSIKSINDALTQIIINEPLYISLTNQTWEIRRRAVADSTLAVNAGVAARLVTTSGVNGIYPLQSGDVGHDSFGTLVFWPDDVGSGEQRFDGATTSGTGTFTTTGSPFTIDDVGRVLVIETGSDKGWYKISAFSAGNQITVQNLYTGAAVNFTASASGLTYKMYGERRFKAARYTTVLRA